MLFEARIFAPSRLFYLQLPTRLHLMMSKLSHHFLRAFALSSALLLGACTSNDSPVTPATYADDAGTTARVRIALMQNPQWRPADLQITTEAGVVRITGYPPAGTDLGAEELQHLVEQVDGVRGTDIELHRRR